MKREDLVRLVSLAIDEADETTDDMEHGLAVWEQSEGLAAAAVDAVLSAVADDLQAVAEDARLIQRRSLAVPEPQVLAIGQAYPLAVERIRSLISPTQEESKP